MSWKEFHTKYKEQIEQLAHVGAGWFFTWAFSLVAAPWAAVWLMLTMASAREVIQHYPSSPKTGSVFDLIFFFIGGLLCVL